MERVIRKLMASNLPPSFKFKDTYDSIELPSGYTLPSQQNIEDEFDTLLAEENEIPKTSFLGDLEIGTSNLFVDTSVSSVGIGTDSPAYKLDVHGTANVGVLTATSISGPLTGNADTATALATARTIGGVSFDGTADINLPGVNTSGTQDTSGNAATATALETARTIGGVSFDGTADINLPGVNTSGTQDTSGNAATATALETARTIGGVSFDGSGNINLPGVNIAGNQNTSGNAATATALATARTIGGVSFDGSGNINLPGVNIAGNQNTSGNAATATALATARTIALTGDVTGSATFDGSGNISISTTNSGGGGNADTVDNLHASSFFRRDTSNDVDVRLAAGSGRGVRFWDSDSYKIWMSDATDTTWGGRLSSDSDYNMYFRMDGGTNRGFVFKSGSTNRCHITGGGDLYLNGGWLRTYGSRGWYNETHGGGWYMTDSTWVRAYNNKGVYAAGAFYTDSNRSVIRGSSPTLYFRDTNGYSAMLHNNSNLLYVLRGSTDTESWTMVNSRWPWMFNLSNNDSTCGRNLYCYGNVTAYSDIRHKKDILKLDNSLEKVCKLNGYTYTRIDDDSRCTGVIAQEVLEVLPEAVDTDEKGEYAVAYGNMAGLFIEAFKELNSKLESAMARIKELENTPK
jgi:hypothetical protein